MEIAQKFHLAEQIAALVQSRLGKSDPELSRLVAQEVDSALAARPFALSDFDKTLRAQEEPEIERVVVTANGRNCRGVVARLATALYDFHGDIRDISQTIVGDYFTMIVVVDITRAKREGSHMNQLRECLHALGAELGIHIVVMHDDILQTMHSV